LQVSVKVEAAVAAFRRSVEEFVRHEATMRFLASKGAIPSSLKHAAMFTENDRDRVTPDPRWVTAIAELSRDPDAELPRT
jgi:hypothetical protein